MCLAQVMDNFLMLISGTKRVVLFQPTDALFMYLQGTCSSVEHYSEKLILFSNLVYG